MTLRFAVNSNYDQNTNTNEDRKEFHDVDRIAMIYVQKCKLFMHFS